MKPSKGSNYLRKGRTSIKNQHYLLTTTVLGRKPVFNREDAAAAVLNSLHWLEKQGKIALDAAVVMPNHLHFVAGLKNDSLATIMRSLKSHTAKQINILLERDMPFERMKILTKWFYTHCIIRFAPVWLRIFVNILFGTVGGMFKVDYGRF